MNPGTYKGRITEVTFGKSANKGTPQVTLRLVAPEGSIDWVGYFSESPASKEITYRALRACGWRTQDLGDVEKLAGNEVSFGVVHEEYNGNPIPRVKWLGVERGPTGGVAMSDAEKKAFFDRMRASVLALAPVRDGDEIPF